MARSTVDAEERAWALLAVASEQAKVDLKGAVAMVRCIEDANMRERALRFVAWERAKALAEFFS